METTIKVNKTVNIVWLRVDAGVRYWEDATVNGVEDTEGDLIPCREGDSWKPLIDVTKGIIVNWNQGVKADIHYKICDDGRYFLLDENDNVVMSIEDDYVPDCLSPKSNGYGDYIIMDVSEDGKISNWKFSTKGFDGTED